MTITKNKRYDWIDASRGIAIILVAFCHIYFEYTRIYIYSFLIPLFFFISGLVYQNKKYKNTISFCKAKARRLLYPYLLWSLILFLFWAIADAGEYSITNGFLGIFYGVCLHNYLDWGMMMWFIPTLFLTEIIHDYIVRRTKYTSIYILLLVIIGYTYNYYFNVPLPWNVNISLVMLLFYYLGTKSLTLLEELKKTQIYWLLPLLLIIFYLSSTMNGEIYSELGKFQNPILYSISGLSGSLFILLINKIIHLKLLINIGINSLLIMILHLRTFTAFKAIEKYILQIEHQDSLIIALSFTLLAVISITFLSQLVKRHFKYLITSPF